MLDALTNNAGGVRTPDFLLLLGKKDITRNISKRLISMTLTDNRAFEVDQLNILLDDTDGLLELPARGAVLTLFLGWKETSLVEKGSFTVDTVEHRGSPDTVTLVARSADLSGALNAGQEESWHDTTLGAIVESIAARHALTPCIAAELAGIPVPHIDKSQESDAVFLTRLADRNGGEVAIKADRLLLMKAGRGISVSGKPVAPVTLTRSDGDQHVFSIADRQAYSGVTARWLDTKDPKQQQQKVSVDLKLKAQPKNAVVHPNAAPVKKNQAANAPDVKENEYLFGKAGNVFAITTVFATKAQAIRAAQAKWDKLQRDKVEFTINLAIGREALYPETPVKVTGFKRIIDEQPWIITRVVHTINDNGFTTALKLEVNISDVDFETKIDEVAFQ